MNKLMIIIMTFASNFALAQACPNGICPCPDNSVWIAENQRCELVAERDFLCIGGNQATIVRTRGQVLANRAARNILGVNRFRVECLILDEDTSYQLKSILPIVE